MTGAVRPGAGLHSAAEAVVVLLAAAGDDAAFTELVRRRQSVVRSLLRRLCGQPALADDLSQQTFLQAWQRLKSLREPAAFGGWLRQIAVNTWISHVRAQSPAVAATAALSEELIDRTVVDPAGALDMDRLLARLKPQERVCVVLAHVEGLSHSEIATATGWPLGTVKSHVLRGTAQLRQWLEPSQSVAS